MSSDARERIEAWIQAHEKPSISIDYDKPKAPIPVGASKIGGCPDVPAAFIWPRYKGGDGLDEGREGIERPLTFIAQFDLAEVAAFDTSGLLPKAGHVAFFYDNEGNYEGGMCDEDGARVFYFPPGAALERMALPDDMGEWDIPELALKFSTRTSRPVRNDWPLALQEASEPFSDEYEKQHDAEEGCKLLGCPAVIQNPMEVECQLTAMELEWGAQDAPETRDAVLAGMKDWVLLCQIDSLYVTRYADVMFGYDSGTLYFWIRKQDLAACHFDKTCLLLQYY